MNKEFTLAITATYRKFKEKDRSFSLFSHFLAVLALKYLHDTKGKFYDLSLEPSVQSGVRSLFERVPDAPVSTALDEVISRVNKHHKSLIGDLFKTISFRSLSFATPEVSREIKLSTLLEDVANLSFGDTKEAVEATAISVIYMIEKYAEENFHKEGFLYTPRSICVLIAHLISYQGSESIYDPAAGFGTLLVHAAKAAKAHSVELFGQESNPIFLQLCKFNLLFSGFAKATIEQGDSLSQSKFGVGKKQRTFDYVICHPPFNENGLLPAEPELLFASPKHKKMALAEASANTSVLARKKTSSSHKSDSDFFSHIIRSLSPQGKAVMIVPHGVLFKTGVSYLLRKQLIGNNLVKAVIDLPANIFYSNKVNVSILILDKNKKNSDVLFIDASRSFDPDRRRNKMRQVHINPVLETYRLFKTVEGYSYKATIEEIQDEDNNYNLTVKRYIRHSEEFKNFDLKNLEGDIQELTGMLTRLRQVLDKEIKALSHE
jgi:type I restriction enzyme M protein